MRLTTLTAAVALVAAAAAPARALADGELHRAFTYGGSDCVEPIASVTVPVERVRPYVPDPYVPVGTGGDGTADVALNVASCGRLVLDGRALAGRVVVDVGVAIFSPDGTAGSHMLQISHSDADPALARAMADAAVPGGQVDGLVAEDTGAGAARSQVPGGLDPFSVAVSGAVAPVANADAVTWWLPTARRGLVRLAYRFPAARLDAGSARVTVPAGTRLERLLGGTDVAARGFIGHLAFEGFVDTERDAASAGTPSTPAGAGAGTTATAQGPATGTAARPRLTVTPRRVAAGRRARLLVRLRPARRGVVVRLGSRRARTDRRGVARFVVRLRRGTHRLVAQGPGARGVDVVAR